MFILSEAYGIDRHRYLQSVLESYSVLLSQYFVEPSSAVITPTALSGCFSGLASEFLLNVGRKNYSNTPICFQIYSSVEVAAEFRVSVQEGEPPPHSHVF